jgi:transposase-like protein
MNPLPFPETLLEFQNTFPNESACAAYLEKLRWPDGFSCQRCGLAGEPYRFAKRITVLRCRSCGADNRLTAGTVMQDSKMPLQTWFWAAYLVTSYTPGISATQFQRQLGINRYETAFQMLHKLRIATVRPDRDLIGSDGHVEVDEAFVGGRTRGKGQGMTHKVLVGAAVEVRTLDKPRRNGERKVYAGRLRLALITDRKKATLDKFVRESVLTGSKVITDGWYGYDNLKALGYDHQPTVIGGDDEKIDAVLPMVHLVFSNLKTWLLGTHHGVSSRHLAAYLNEFTFRFNRRFYPMISVNSVLGIMTSTPGRTYKDLYEKKRGSGERD